jgi:hypothetical protein
MAAKADHDKIPPLDHGRLMAKKDRSHDVQKMMGYPKGNL